MALSPPMHIDFKGVWTLEMYQDWNDFQAEQQVDGMERVPFLFRSQPFLFRLVARVLLDCSLGFTWLCLLFGSGSTVGVLMLHTCAHWCILSP